MAEPTQTDLRYSVPGINDSFGKKVEWKKKVEKLAQYTENRFGVDSLFIHTFQNVI